MQQVFISHSVEDADSANELAHSLRSRGVEVWIAPSSILPGEEFVDAIQRGLGGSTHFVVLMSPQALESSWVKMEINTAIRLEREQKLAIAPVEYQSVERPLLLGNYQWLSYRQGLDTLVESLLSWIGVGDSSSWAGPRDIPQEQLTEQADALQSLADAIRVCELCGLHRERFQAVPGDGPGSARLMFIGEAPGPEDDRTGIPFVSAAGEFLEELLDLIDIKRGDVFMTNIVKCRPHENRDPLASEVRACSGYLDRQLELVNPQAIVTLGRHSLARIVPGLKLSEVHGQPQQLGDRTVFPMYHPAAALYRSRYRMILIKDFQAMQRFLISRSS